MKHQIELVEKFHTAFGAPVGEAPMMPSEERLKLRCKLMLEEVLEFIEAAGFVVGVDNLTDEIKTINDCHIQRVLSRDPNFVEMCDAIKDLQVVTHGTEIEMGIQDIADEMFEHVMESNMSKLGEDGKPIYRADGKILKGPNFFKPFLNQFLPPTIPERQ